MSLLSAVACTGTPSTTEGGGVTTAAGGDGASAGAGGSGGSGGGGGSGGSGGGVGASGAAGGGGSSTALTLDDDGLVVRYYIDEASSGQMPAALLDSAALPLDLPLTYVPQLSYAGPDGQRGLRSQAIGQDGRASVLADDTKLPPALNGSPTVTFEVVASVTKLQTNASRFIHFGDSSISGELTLSAGWPNRLNFFWQGYTLLGEFVIPMDDGERFVMHAVLDTQQADEAERARAYRNGGRAIRDGGTAPDLDETIDIPLNRYFVIGNRQVGERSLEGTIHYAAIYNVALSDEQIKRHAHVLLTNDDSPALANPN